MQYLSDQMLMEVYQRAVDLRLDSAFIELLYNEMRRRNLVNAEASA